MTEKHDATEVREHLVRALQADLVGPFLPDDEEFVERLPLPPSRWYLTGFLAPEGGREMEDPTEEEELAAGPDLDDEETTGDDPDPRPRRTFPASLGLSVLVPAASGTGPMNISVTIRYADYARERTEDSPPRQVWRRTARRPVPVELTLNAEVLGKGIPVPESGGLWLQGQLRETAAPGLPAGTSALSLFLVNRREPKGKPLADERFIFQVSVELFFEPGFVARPNRRGEQPSRDVDDRTADLQFRDRFEYVVGHGVSVETLAASTPDAPVQRVRTTWFPRSEVRRVITHAEPDVVVAMDDLAALQDGAAASRSLSPLVTAYRSWIRQQARIPVDSEERIQVRDALVDQAERASRRIEAGVALLEDPQVRRAFCLANRAMAESARHRSPERYEGDRRPEWRLFQLAFLLLNLKGIVEPEGDDRETVELIYFPTGGGKTEAYLGVIAFTLLLRRLRGRERPDRGLGVAVILRYTLRLLTLDQLGRAATLMCALEKIRDEAKEELGQVRFAVGLWVGKTATANTMGEVKDRIIEYKNSSSKYAPSPCPITRCPWCGTELNRDSLHVRPNKTQPTEVVVACTDHRCDFAAGRRPEGIPVVFVDEQVYQELPCFLVATVDKFAMLPWRGETGMLFGRVDACEGRSFFGPAGRVAPKAATKLPAGLLPPELIVQDELHLNSRPLGTMVGLYETAIEALCTRTDGERSIRPKILAATATVRQAQKQVNALFSRPVLAVFPPPGVDDSETFFARVDHDHPGRLYVGLAAPGRAVKSLLLRAYTVLLGAARRQFDPEAGGDQPADAYMTLVGYFNSLRELGGMRRLVEDEVRTRCDQAEERRPVDHTGRHPWVARRKVQPEPIELTSRESTARIKTAKDRLGRAFVEAEPVDVCLASNMISVGVDIDRLGLMVVAGQPKTTSEYIQASSRVGRVESRPGLVVTCLNVHRPRDRSHLERFPFYHESFYRDVEAQSLTPFSGPALDRGLAGVLVALSRLMDRAMTPSEAAMEIGQHRGIAEDAVDRLARRAAGLVRDPTDGRRLEATLRKRGRDLLDEWERIVRSTLEGAGKLPYSPYDRPRLGGRALLWAVTDEERPLPGSPEEKFSAPTSMRDVEPTTHLWIERGRLGGRS